MATIERTALVAVPREVIFDVVNDVAAYPSFVPNCRQTTVYTQTETVMEASLNLSKGPITQTFTTRNSLSRPDSIKMLLVDGPFKSFKGLWQFEALNEESCKVTFTLDFEFQSKLIAISFGPLFESVSARLIDAFVKQAKLRRQAK